MSDDNINDDNTKNLDKYAEELSDYLNDLNKEISSPIETPGCGKAIVYKDLYDIIDVEPSTLNIQGNSLDKSINLYAIKSMKQWFPEDNIHYSNQTIKILFNQTNMDIIAFIKNMIQYMETNKTDTYTPKNIHRCHVDSKPHDDVTAIILSAGGPRALPPLLCMHQGVCKDQEEEIPRCQKNQKQNKNQNKIRTKLKIGSLFFFMARKLEKSIF